MFDLFRRSKGKLNDFSKVNDDVSFMIMNFQEISKILGIH